MNKTNVETLQMCISLMNETSSVILNISVTDLLQRPPPACLYKYIYICSQNVSLLIVSLKMSHCLLRVTASVNVVFRVLPWAYHICSATHAGTTSGAH